MQPAEQMKNAIVTEQKVNDTSLTRYHYKTIGSTQDVADECAKYLGPTNWILITADEQTKGRGRTYYRSWASPPNVNIYATFIFPFPKNKMNLLLNISQITAWAVVLTLEDLGLKPKVKWVNDIFLNKKKIGGVLCRCEAPPHLKNHLAVKVGIGINVNMSKEICDALDQPVTSMLVESGRQFNKEKILSNFQKKLKMTVELLLIQGFAPFAEMISQKMEFMGENVKIKDDSSNAIIEGKIQGFDIDGALLLESGSRTQRLIYGHIIPQRSIDCLTVIGQTLSQFNFDHSTTATVLQYIENDGILIDHAITPHFKALNKKGNYGTNILDNTVKPQKLSKL